MAEKKKTATSGYAQVVPGTTYYCVEEPYRQMMGFPGLDLTPWEELTEVERDAWCVFYLSIIKTYLDRKKEKKEGKEKSDG